MFYSAFGYHSPPPPTTTTQARRTCCRVSVTFQPVRLNECNTLLLKENVPSQHILTSDGHTEVGSGFVGISGKKNAVSVYLLKTEASKIRLRIFLSKVYLVLMLALKLSIEQMQSYKRYANASQNTDRKTWPGIWMHWPAKMYWRHVYGSLKGI